MAGRSKQAFRPELRKDPINNRLVLIADRQGRPSGQLREQYRAPEACPFCPGREHTTPDPTLLMPDDSGGPADWRLRVVPNLYAAVTTDVDMTHTGVWLFDQTSGYGYHEVVIESPEHYQLLWAMPEDQVLLIIEAWCQRLDAIRRDPHVRYVSIFRNYRLTAGASLLHPHSQIIAVPVTPPAMAIKLQHSRHFYAAHSRCVFCDLIAFERKEAARVIYENDHFVAIAPYASRVPFEICIYPLRHQHDLLVMTDDEKLSLVRTLQEVLGRLYAYLGYFDENLGTDLNVPYNLVVNTAPSTHARPGRPDYWATLKLDFHWHIEIIPRVTRLAGFEWGSGIIINPMLPERAAETLRSVEKPRTRLAEHRAPRGGAG